MKTISKLNWQKIGEGELPFYICVQNIFCPKIYEQKHTCSPGLNFINVLRTAFTHVDPESVRIQSNPQYLFTLLGSTCAKAVRRTLMKLTYGQIMTNENK